MGKRASRKTCRFLTLRRALLTTVLLALGLWIGANAYLGRLSSIPTPFISEMEATASIQRLMVVAPHCDDELLGSGGLIQQVLNNGGQVRVVIVTNGDGSPTGAIVEFRRLSIRASDYIRSGTGRQQESLNALAALGVAPQDVIFLSYPDQGTMRLWEIHWDDDSPFRSPYTRLTQSPYFRTYNPEAVYSGHSLLSDLRAIMRDFRPDTVVAPHHADVHLDHWAGGAFTALATTMLGEVPQPRLLLYLVHRADYPLPRGHLPFAPLLPPLRLVNDTSFWSKVTFPNEIVAAKGEAIELYATQLPLLGNFLRSFVRQNELFCEPDPFTTPQLVRDQTICPDICNWETLDGAEVVPLIEDSARDSASQEVGAGADFVALYAARTEIELWISAELRGKPNPILSYSCLVRAGNGSEVSRSRVLFPTRLGARLPTVAQGHFLLARFSLAELGFPSAVVVSCSCAYPGGKVIDRIGWAVVNLH
jgi:LmbE family N-acetylglucosaminyl deacetylase